MLMKADPRVARKPLPYLGHRTMAEVMETERLLRFHESGGKLPLKALARLVLLKRAAVEPQ